MIDHSEESLLTIKEACGILPGQPHLATVWRWIMRGVRGVKLETILSGGRRYTSHEAVKRFIEASTAAAHSMHSPAPRVAPQRREASIVRAESELER